MLQTEVENVKTKHPRFVQSALEIFSTNIALSEAFTSNPCNETTDLCEELIKSERDSSRECSPDADVPLADLKRSGGNVKAPYERLVRIAPAINGIPCLLEDIKSEKEVEDSPPVLESNKILEPKQTEQQENNKKYSDKILTITLSEKEMEEERERDRKRPVFLERTFKCNKCIIGFDHEPYFKEHNEKRHAEIPDGHSCKVCESVFAKKPSFLRHWKIHFTRYQCVICGLRLLNYYSMTQHYSKHHEIAELAYKCSQCDHVANSHRSLRYHRSTHRSKPICSECGTSFTNYSALKVHMMTIHKQASLKLACSLCPKVFKNRTGLVAHRKGSHSDRVFYCGTCDVFFKTQVSYNAHNKFSSKHVSEDDKRFTCDQCGSKYLTKPQLQKHIEFVHIGVLPVNCDECDKPFKDKGALKRHKIYVHEKKRPARTKICDYCGRGFTTTATLITHVRTHTGERPLVCSYCNATFAHPAALYTHTKLLHKQTGKRKK